MGKKYKDLFQQVIDINNIRDAYLRTAKGDNRYSPGHMEFKENLELNLWSIKNELESESYKLGKFYYFLVHEPKQRLISALPFRDRVVQHAINTVIEPVFEKVFYPCSYSCRYGKGTHKCVKDVQASLRRVSKMGKVYYLKMDFEKFFYSIPIVILMREVKRKISDIRLSNLIQRILGEGFGLPVGSLLSQILSNLFGHIFDRFIKTKLKAKNYFRYADDTVIISNCKSWLKRVRVILEKFSGIFLKLKFSNWYLNSLAQPLNFVGYRLSTTHKLIRKDSLTRAKRKIRYYIRTGQVEKLNRFLSAWSGHIKTADCWNLVKKLSGENGLWIKEKRLIHP